MAILVGMAGCQRSTPPSPASSSEKPKVEADLGKTAITRQAAESLGIRVAAAATKEVQERRRFTGWIMPRTGREVTVTAPLAGHVHAPKDGLPTPGMRVRDGHTLLTLEPVLSPVEVIQLASLKRGVEGELGKAQESLQVAESELKRVQDLFKQKLRGQQDVEQAQARFNLAKVDVNAARDKLKLFPESGSKDLTRLAPMTIQAPRAGTILTVHASPGQFVAAAAPLLSLVDLSDPWVRVQVPEQELGEVDRKAPAQVVSWTTARPATPKPLAAKPLDLVPQIDPIRHTADLLYELNPKDVPANIAKDQMVFVDVAMGTTAKQSVVPYGAIIYDAYGGSWVYLDRSKKDGDRLFERRRVELGPAVEGGVIVRPALGASDLVVVEGAAALFSREFFRPPIVLAD